MSNQRIENEEEEEIFIPGLLHKIFPETRLEQNDAVSYVQRQIKHNLMKASGSLLLSLLIKKTFEGTSACERLLNILQNTERKVCVPWFVNSGGKQEIGQKLSKGIFFEQRDAYDILFINLSQKSGVTVHNTTLESNRRIFIQWVVRILLASTQTPPELRHVTFCCLNNQESLSFWKKYIHFIEVEDILNVARETITNENYFVCRIPVCNGNCRALFHSQEFIVFEDPYNFVRNVDAENNSGEDETINLSVSSDITIGVYHVWSFGLGPSVILSQRFQTTPGNHRMTDLEIVYGLESTLRAYQVLCMNHFTYLVAGAHIPSNGQQAPDSLSIQYLQGGNDVYFYVGISQYEGIGPHNFKDFSTNFAHCIKAKRLNTFWMIKNYHFRSYQLAEKQEVLLQLMLRRIIVCNQELVNLKCCNLRLEISAMDLFTDDELGQIVAILDDVSMPFICNTMDDIPMRRNYQVFQSPIQLAQAQKYYDC